MNRLHTGRLTRSLTVAGIVFGISVGAQAGDIRSIDGSGNNLNPDKTTWGQADTELIRLVPAAYEDGVAVPRGGDPTSLPSARAISNAVSGQSGSVPNSLGVSDWLWQWGQFVDHDLDLTGGADPAEAFNIDVPTDDMHFDPMGYGDKEIGLSRSVYDDTSGVREQINQITSYIDASNVYGSDATRAEALRALDGTGMLKTSAGNLLPFNTAGLPNADMGPDPSVFFLAGDVRANEQVGLTATHTLFVREHNRLAQDILARLALNDAVMIEKFNDSGLAVGEFAYESARKIVGAQMQLITYNEFLPTLLGPDALDVYTGYNDGVNAGVSNEFATAAYRLGHTLLSPEIRRVNNDGTEASEGNIALRDAFFSPQEVIDHGIDSLLLGLAYGESQELDTLLVDDVRNFLFGPPGMGGFDLASLNIQRGRDHGLPSLNAFREAFFGAGAGYDSFFDLAGGNGELADAFASVYGSVDEVDLWAGGLAEPGVNGGMVGETFFAIIADQFTRVRDGDRFFYLDHLEHLLAFDAELERTTLAAIIQRNTDINSMHENVFAVGGQLVVPEPLTGTLGVLSLIALAQTTRRRV